MWLGLYAFGIYNIRWDNDNIRCSVVSTRFFLYVRWCYKHTAMCSSYDGLNKRSPVVRFQCSKFKINDGSVALGHGFAIATIKWLLIWFFICTNLQGEKNGPYFAYEMWLFDDDARWKYIWSIFCCKICIFHMLRPGHGFYMHKTFQVIWDIFGFYPAI